MGMKRSGVSIPKPSPVPSVAMAGRAVRRDAGTEAARRAALLEVLRTVMTGATVRDMVGERAGARAVKGAALTKAAFIFAVVVWCEVLTVGKQVDCLGRGTRRCVGGEVE